MKNKPGAVAGAHATYQLINPHTGAKIFKKKYAPLAPLEFLITQYVTYCGILNSTKSIKINSRTNTLFMHHINGPTLNTLIHCTMNQYKHYFQNTTLTYDDKFDFVIQRPELKPLAKQHDTLIAKLQTIGLSADDHTENFDNFIVTDGPTLVAIDYSYEAAIIKPDLIYYILQSLGHAQYK